MKTDVILDVTPSIFLNIYIAVHIFRNLGASSNSRHQKGDMQFLMRTHKCYLTFIEPCIARCIFYITNVMQPIHCSLIFSTQPHQR
jgi:hypothetical protein